MNDLTITITQVLGCISIIYSLIRIVSLCRLGKPAYVYIVLLAWVISSLYFLDLFIQSNL